MQGSRSLDSLVLAYLPGALTLGLLVILCWALAQWTWLFVAPVPPAAPPSPELAVDLPGARDMVAKTSLFDSQAGTSRAEVTPRTALDVKLVGVLESSPKKGRSLAVMNVNGKANALYAEGKEIAPDIVLHRIARNHVVIRHRGALERVDFPEKTAGGKASGFDLNVQQQAAGHYSFSRDTLNRALQDPIQLGQLGALAIVPGAGAIIGQVPAGSLMEKLGLQPGDTIRAVNGEQLNSQDDLLRLYQRFATTGQVTLQGSRAGAPLSLTYAVKP